MKRGLVIEAYLAVVWAMCVGGPVPPLLSKMLESPLSCVVYTAETKRYGRTGRM